MNTRPRQSGFTLAQSDASRASGLVDMTEGLKSLKQTQFICWQGFFASILAQELVAENDLEQAGSMIFEHIGICQTCKEDQFLPLLYLAEAKYWQKIGNTDAMGEALTRGKQLAQSNGAAAWLSQIAGFENENG